MNGSDYTERRGTRGMILASGTTAAALGLISLVGWIVRLPVLASFGANLVPTAPSTAVLFVLIGTAVTLAATSTRRRELHILKSAIALLVAMSGLFLFISSINSVFFSIELLGFSTDGMRKATFGGIVVGHMSPATAACFLVSSLALLFTPANDVNQRVRAAGAFVLSSIVFCASSLLVVSYLYSSPVMYSGNLIPPAMPTSSGFLALSIGLLIIAGNRLWPNRGIQDAAMAQTSYVLATIFVLVVAAVLSGGYSAYRSYERSFRTEVEQQLSSVAELKVGQIESWRSNRLGEGQLFYKNDVFSALVKRYMQNPNDFKAKKGIVTWVAQIQGIFRYDLMMLLDARLNTILVVPESRARPAMVIDQTSAERLSLGIVVFQDFYRNDQDQRIYLKVVVPILDNQFSKRLIAVLALRISPDEVLFPLLKKWPTPSRTAETLIIRRDGNDALFLNELRFPTNAPPNRRIPLDRTDVPAVMAVLGQKGIVEGIDYRGEQTIADIRPVPGSPWYLVARMDAEEVYAPLRERLWLLIILVGALISAAGSAVGLVWRRQRNRFYQEENKLAAALQDSELRFRSIFENMLEGVALHEMIYDDNGIPVDYRIVDANGAFETQTGISLQKALGALASELYGVGCPPYLAEYNEVASSRKPISFETHFQSMGRDFSISVISPKPGYFATIFLDVTDSNRSEAEMSRLYALSERSRLDLLSVLEDQKQVELSLRESENEFRRLAEAMPQIVWITRPDGRNIYFNQHWVDYTGLTLEESYGDGWNKPFHPDDKQRAWDAWQNATQHGAVYALECRLRRADGVYTWWLVRGVPIMDARGTVLKWYGTCTDIDELKLAEEEIQKLNVGLELRVLERTAQLEAANKELEAFSYSVSHDLRAPLRAIDGFSRIVKEEYTQRLDDEGKRLLNIICDNTKKMDELITDMLDLSRVSKNELKHSLVDMKSLAYSIYYEAASPEIRQRFSFSVAPIPDAFCDPSLMKQVWRNLISNAIKFTTPTDERTIGIGGRSEGGMNLYFIKDSGVGFDPRYTHKLFGVFQRLHRAEEFEGTGVGLAIVQRIIHRHGGRVWADSTVGEGATFWFSLPAREA